MASMPARQARRPRRVVAPSSLPRPTAAESFADDPVVHTPAAATPAPRSAPRRQLGVRAHHVTEDYGYVRKDLVLVAAISAISLGFVVAMSFLM
jgi:hypothetical protein